MLLPLSIWLEDPVYRSCLKIQNSHSLSHYGSVARTQDVRRRSLALSHSSLGFHKGLHASDYLAYSLYFDHLASTAISGSLFCTPDGLHPTHQAFTLTTQYSAQRWPLPTDSGGGTLCHFSRKTGTESPTCGHSADPPCG